MQWSSTRPHIESPTITRGMALVPALVDVGHCLLVLRNVRDYARPENEKLLRSTRSIERQGSSPRSVRGTKGSVVQHILSQHLLISQQYALAPFSEFLEHAIQLT